jgi:uncharacterized protein (TIGR02646 family)
MSNQIKVLAEAGNKYFKNICTNEGHVEEVKCLIKALRKISCAGKADIWGKLYKATYTLSCGSEITGKEIRRQLSKHLVELQKGRCCYCRRRLQNIAYARPIEHILSRSDYPQFSMHYANLAIACFDCNHLKSDTNWTSVPLKTRRYPGLAKAKDFYHPRLHNYDKHIRYIFHETNEIAISLYFGLTPQGRKLCFNHLQHIAKREQLIKNNKRLEKSMTTLQEFGFKESHLGMTQVQAFIDGLNKKITGIT